MGRVSRKQIMGDLGVGTVELLLFSLPEIFFFFEPVKNVPAPKVILRLRPRVQNLVHVSL